VKIFAYRLHLVFNLNIVSDDSTVSKWKETNCLHSAQGRFDLREDSVADLS